MAVNLRVSGSSKTRIDKALALATGGSPTIRSAYLHTIVDNANRNGQIYVVGPDPEFDGVALWAPPGVDWTPWYVCALFNFFWVFMFLFFWSDDKDYRKLLPADVLEWLVHHVCLSFLYISLR